jgi:hypothetical protein
MRGRNPAGMRVLLNAGPGGALAEAVGAIRRAACPATAPLPRLPSPARDPGHRQTPGPCTWPAPRLASVDYSPTDPAAMALRRRGACCSRTAAAITAAGPTGGGTAHHHPEAVLQAADELRNRESVPGSPPLAPLTGSPAGGALPVASACRWGFSPRCSSLSCGAACRDGSRRLESPAGNSGCGCVPTPPVM